MNGSTDYLSVHADASVSYNVVPNNFWFSASLTNQTLTEVVGTTASVRASINAAQAIPQNVITKVALNQAQFDPQSWLNYANNRIIPTIPGYYQFSSLGSWQVTTEFNRSIQVRKNGAAITVADTFTAGGTMELSDAVYMNGSTDYLELYVFQASAAAVNLDNNIAYTFFIVSLVGANQAVPAVRETTSAYGIGSNTTGSNQYANCELDNLRFFWRGGGGASVFISTISGTTTIQGAYGRNAYGGGADALGLAPGTGSGPLTVTTTPVALTVNWSTMGQIIATFRDIGAGRSYQMNAILQHSYQNSQIFVNRISD
jgi:hypothetical protein